MTTIALCPSCDGYGWLEDDEAGAAEECGWCAGAGYVYRDERGVDRAIPTADYAAVAPELERLETERLRDMGYTGSAIKPWEQQVRGENMARMKRDNGQSG
jgi:hypothetical protein